MHCIQTFSTFFFIFLQFTPCDRNRISDVWKILWRLTTSKLCIWYRQMKRSQTARKSNYSKGKKLKATKKTSDNAPLKKRTRRLRRYAALRETQLYGCCCYVSIKQYLILLYSFTALLCLARLSIVLCCVVNRKKRRKKLTK